MHAGTPPRMVYRFDRFTLDLARGALLGPEGAELPLRPKSFALLQLLVENAGRLLDRDAIMAAVWPDLFVTDDSIAQCISSIRRALGDDAQRLLRTVPKRGYLFAAEVTSADRVEENPRSMRRLAAILAADVVGYSRLMGTDEPGALARLQAHRNELIAPLVARHRGRVVNHAGDSVLCEFASAIEAVACAAAIQDGMTDRDQELPEDERVRYRIGVNVGDVLVEGEEIYGDGVNVAARLESIAEPGGVCVSGKVHDEVRGKLDLCFEDLGELRLKNIAEPVRAWRVADVAALPMQRVAGLLRGDPKRHATGDGAAEGVVVDLARFRKREAPVHTAPDAPALLAEHNLPQPNSNFVGRSAELAVLHRALTATGRSAITQSRQAISGLGGIGKTQLALAFAYAHLGEYDLICWLRAEEPAVLAADYAGLALALGLAPGPTDQAALVAAVRGRLERAQRWLLVFDNAVQPGALDPYLPRTGGGHVLVTSRWQDWEGTAAALELELLPESEAVALLLGDGAGNPAQRAAAANLARELGCLPLALAQARAFMRARRLGVAAYRQQLAAARSKVLAWRPPDASYPIAVAQAWQVSLDHASQDCPTAAELLRLLAFLGPDAVPRDLLGVMPEALPEALRDLFDRDGAVEALARYSLLRAAPDSLTVHRLVQAVTRDGLNEEAGGRFAAMAVALVDAALPPPTWDSVHRQAIERLLPQALAAIEAAEPFGVGLASVGGILTLVGEYLIASAASAEAVPLLQRAISVREQVLGPVHPDLAISLHKLANAYSNLDCLAEAEPLYRRVVEIHERAFEPGHPLIAEALGCLGLHLMYAGRRAEAEPIIQRSLASYERTVGPGHPDLALSLYHMAWLYRLTGQSSAAEQYYLRAIAAAEQALGHEHRRVARFLDTLAVFYRSSGRDAEAEPLLQRALAIAEHQASPRDPNLALSLNRLAGMYRATGRYAEAEPLLRRALELRERTLGPDHPRVALSLEHLGQNYHDIGRHAEAEPLFQRALAIAEQARAWGHPDLDILLRELAEGCIRTCRYAAAEPLIQHLLEMKERTLGPEHPLFADILFGLADGYADNGQFAAAEPLLLRSLAIYEKALGPEHERAGALYDMAKVYISTRRSNEAEPLLDRALAIQERRLGPEHRFVGGTLYRLAQVYLDTDRAIEAEPLLVRSLTIHEAKYGPEHLNTSSPLSALGRVYRETGRYAEAEPLLRRCLEIINKAPQPDHGQLALVLDNYAVVLDQLGRGEEAAGLRERARTARDPICILDHDPRWSEFFRALAERVRATLGNAVVAIEHVGSTAVPGLAGKPVIDLDVVVLPRNFELAIKGLASLGYAHKGDQGVVGREAFRWPAGETRHHLYLCAPDSAALRDHLRFRDYLRAHPETAREYAALKRKLARHNAGDREAYQAAKSGFIEEVTRRAVVVFGGTPPTASSIDAQL